MGGLCSADGRIEADPHHKPHNRAARPPARTSEALVPLGSRHPALLAALLTAALLALVATRLVAGLVAALLPYVVEFIDAWPPWEAKPREGLLPPPLTHPPPTIFPILPLPLPKFLRSEGNVSGEGGLSDYVSRVTLAGNNFTP